MRPYNEDHSVKRTDKRTISPHKRILLAILCILGVLCIALISFSPFSADHQIAENGASIGQDGDARDAVEHYQETVLPENDAREGTLHDNRDEDLSDEVPEGLSEGSENDPNYNPADDMSAGLSTPGEPYEYETYEPYGPNEPPGIKYEGHFELPVRGATGWAAARLGMYSEPDDTVASVLTLQPGQGFLILEEYEMWWNIRLGSGEEGWVKHRHCFINLPDIIPSIIYNVTNARSSVKRSNMTDIPNITGYALYNAHSFNDRFGRDEFIVPILYYTSFKVMQVQRSALEDGNTLIVYEMFRPRSTQHSVANNLRNLMNTNRDVYRAINRSPWSMGWFIGTNLSNHQRGIAMDISLGQIIAEETGQTGEYLYRHIVQYVELEMPTAMHELSSYAVMLSRPVAANSPDAWRGVAFADSMTEAAILLVQYATDVGFTPIASEWWHFNDLDARVVTDEARIVGEFYTETIYSVSPWYM